MQGVFEGFATIGAIIALGVLLAQIGVLDLTAQRVLSRLSFFVASPALMVTVLSRADVGSVLSKNLAATAVAVLVCAVLYVVAARFLWRKPLADTVVGTLCAVYVNAGNLGLPIAAYVLGDAALVAPTLLMQLLVLQPVALAVLDHAVSVATVLGRPGTGASAHQPAHGRVDPGSRARAHRGDAARTGARPARADRRHGGPVDAAGLRHLAASRTATRARHVGRRDRLHHGAQAGGPARHGVRRRAVRPGRGRRRDSSP